MTTPKIHLAIDNCFASKRWTEPREWLDYARRLGVSNVEASADTEADPLYMGPEYMEDWTGEVSICAKRTGVKVVNLYSGHGTYTTLGLGHPDARVRERIREYWVKPMLRAAARLGAGLGFFCHAFSEAVLQDPGRFSRALDQLYDELSQIARYASEVGVCQVGVEQMYSPHQVPWTIKGAQDLLSSVNTLQAPFYLTIDTGHQTGQRKFRPPSQSGSCRDPLDQSGFPGKADSFSYLVSEERDCDPYAWIESLGRYSPIVHLQQVVDGRSSHLPFNDQTNKNGLIQGDRVLQALWRSYQGADSSRMPKPCSDIYLTLEVFSGTSETKAEIFSKLQESVRYWRRFVPQDGVPLDTLRTDAGDGPP